MNRYQQFGCLLIAITALFASCEEVIDVDLTDAAPRVVIEADLREPLDTIWLGQSVPLSQDQSSRAFLPSADIRVVREDGSAVVFRSTAEPGLYVSEGRPTVGVPTDLPAQHYTLIVELDGEQYTSTEYMHDYIEVDSLGMGTRRFFDEDIYYLSFRFQDPANEENFYRYDMSVNGGPFVFAGVYSDRFNDGLYISHEITSPREELVVGDQVKVRRSVISSSVYRYWSDLQSLHPGVAAPANPRSNISNGALGYFSISTGKVYDFEIRDIPDQESEVEEE